MPVNIYKEFPFTSVDTDIVLSQLQEFSLKAEYRGELNQLLDKNPGLAEDYQDTVSRSRVLNIEIPVDYSGNNIEISGQQKEKREIYDGFWIQRKLFKIFNLLASGLNSDDLNIVITDRLIATFGVKRYHARVVVMGNPSIISVSGLIEGPARPREYYFMKAGYIQQGRNAEELDDIFKDQYMVYGDKKISRTIGSYCLQPIFYHYLGKEFCDDSDCSLYNTHWQQEVLRVHAENIICEDCKDRIELISKII